MTDTSDPEHETRELAPWERRVLRDVIHFWLQLSPRERGYLVAIVQVWATGKTGAGMVKFTFWGLAGLISVIAGWEHIREAVRSLVRWLFG